MLGVAEGRVPLLKEAVHSQHNPNNECFVGIPAAAPEHNSVMTEMLASNWKLRERNIASVERQRHGS